MHGLDHSITFNRILAIDLGKFNSVVCLYDPAPPADDAAIWNALARTESDDKAREDVKGED